MKGMIQKRQQPLLDQYNKYPDHARTTHGAVIQGKDLHDPFHTRVVMSEELEIPVTLGMHRDMGGFQDFPTPDDMFCGAFAASFDLTLRMIANRMNMTLIQLSVKVTAERDVRGAMEGGRLISSAYQEVSLHVVIHTDLPMLTEQLIDSALYSCPMYQTLTRAIPVQVNYDNYHKRRVA